MDTSARSTGLSRLVLSVVGTVAAAVLVAGCSSSGGSSGGPGSSGSSGSSGGRTSVTSAGGGSARTGASPTVSNGLQTQFQTVVRKVLPSVVQITTPTGLGSGIVYDTRGDIVTNAHVVGPSRTFKVTLADKSGVLDARLVGSYPPSDLAVIRLDRPPSGLHPATFADSAKVAVGQIVMAMGNPLGLSSSVTQGIVSAVGRTVSEQQSAESPGATIADMVQTSASINPGNSGGALANLSSQVVGINTLAATDPELGGSAAPGIGFAIPSSTVTRIAGQLIRNGKVTDSGRAALGVTVRTFIGNGPSGLEPAGVVIVKVNRGGAAARAGLRAGDVLVKVDGTPVPTTTALSETLAGHRPGDRVKVTFDRGGRTGTAQVTLGTL